MRLSLPITLWTEFSAAKVSKENGVNRRLPITRYKSENRISGTRLWYLMLPLSSEKVKYGSAFISAVDVIMPRSFFPEGKFEGGTIEIPAPVKHTALLCAISLQNLSTTRLHCLISMPGYIPRDGLES